MLDMRKMSKIAFDLEGDSSMAERDQLNQQVDQGQQVQNQELSQQENEVATQQAMAEIQLKANAEKRMIDAEYTNKTLAAIKTFESEMSFLEGNRKNKQFLSNSTSEASASKIIKEVDAEKIMKAEMQQAEADRQMRELSLQQKYQLPPTQEANRVNSSQNIASKKEQEEAQKMQMEQQAQQAQQGQAQQAQQGQAQQAQQGQAQQAQAQPQQGQPQSKKNEVMSSGEGQQEVVDGGSSSAAAPKIAAEKISKSSASYLSKSPIKSRTCQFCSNYIGVSKECMVVEGKVSPQAVCKLFKRGK